MKLNVLPIILLTVLIGCHEKFSATKDEQAVKKLMDEWDQNGQTGKRAANAEFFTDDGVRIEGDKVYSGIEAIRALFNTQQLDKKKFLKIENKIETIWSSEKSVTTTGLRTVSFIRMASGDTITLHSAFVTVLERQPDQTLKVAYNLKNDLK